LTVIILSCQCFFACRGGDLSLSWKALYDGRPTGLVSVLQVWSFAVPPYLYPLNTHGRVAQWDWKRIAQ